MNPDPSAVPHTSNLAILLQDEILGKSKQASLARLLPQVEEKQFAAGEVIYRAQAAADYFYLLIAGEVELISQQGRQVALMAGHFGEEAATGTAHYLTDAIAMRDTCTLRIAHPGIKKLVKYNPDLKTDLLLSLASHLAGEKLLPKNRITIGVANEFEPLALVGWVLAMVLPLCLLLFGQRFGLVSSTTLFLAIFFATMIMWVFNLVDDYIPGLFALMAMLAIGLVPEAVILSGFASDGFLMALSTLALGSVVVSSGLSYRFILFLLHILPNRRFWHNFGLLLTGMVLTPLIPTANGRMTLVTPFYADLLDNLKLPRAGVSSTELAFSSFVGCSLLSSIFITGKSINFAVLGLLSAQAQEQFQWVGWFLSAAISGLVLLVLNGLGAQFWFRGAEAPTLSKQRVAQQLALLGPINPREWSALSGVAFMGLGIITSSIHKVAPPWLGLSMLFGLLLYGTLSKAELKQKVDWTFLLYLSGITGIVATFHYLALDTALGQLLVGLQQPMRHHFGWFILLLFGLVNLVRLLVPINACAVILATIFMPLAESAGVNAWVLGFIILVFSDVWFFPWQCTHYLLLQAQNRKKALYDEKSFLYLNAWMNLARLAAIYAALPFWQLMGLL